MPISSITRSGPGVRSFEQLAERRIEAAIAAGEFDDLPGMGAPLDLDDDRHVPPELRLAYRVLKNSGFAPEAVMWRQAIALLESKLADERAGPARQRLEAELACMRVRLESRR